MAKDFLDEVIADRSRRNPGFSDFVAEAERRRAAGRRRRSRDGQQGHKRVTETKRSSA